MFTSLLLGHICILQQFSPLKSSCYNFNTHRAFEHIPFDNFLNRMLENKLFDGVISEKNIRSEQCGRCLWPCCRQVPLCEAPLWGSSSSFMHANVTSLKTLIYIRYLGLNQSKCISSKQVLVATQTSTNKSQNLIFTVTSR